MGKKEFAIKYYDINKLCFFKDRNGGCFRDKDKILVHFLKPTEMRAYCFRGSLENLKLLVSAQSYSLGHEKFQVDGLNATL